VVRKVRGYFMSGQDFIITHCSGQAFLVFVSRNQISFC
jgi:hypothetical protein